MRKIWDDKAWEDYLYWQLFDKQMLKRLNMLIRDVEREPFSGIGKPEPLRGDWNGFWSRRINDKDRLIYRIDENNIYIIACRYHYGDK